MNADTSPMVQPSLSMKNLQHIISTVSGPPPPGRGPGAVGSRPCQPGGICPPVIASFTLVKAHPGKEICHLVTRRYKFMFPNRPVVWPVFDPVNISGKYRGNALPIPAGNDARAFCLQSAPDTASTEICPAWRPTWHWSASPAALSCKAQLEVSFLLY